MPFSFSNISSTALIVMVLCLTAAQLIDFLRKRLHHSEKKISGNTIGK